MLEKPLSSALNRWRCIWLGSQFGSIRWFNVIGTSNSWNVWNGPVGRKCWEVLVYQISVLLYVFLWEVSFNIVINGENTFSFFFIQSSEHQDFIPVSRNYFTNIQCNSVLPYTVLQVMHCRSNGSPHIKEHSSYILVECHFWHGGSGKLCAVENDCIFDCTQRCSLG